MELRAGFVITLSDRRNFMLETLCVVQYMLRECEDLLKTAHARQHKNRRKSKKLQAGGVISDLVKRYIFCCNKMLTSSHRQYHSQRLKCKPSVKLRLYHAKNGKILTYLRAFTNFLQFHGRHLNILSSPLLALLSTGVLCQYLRIPQTLECNQFLKFKVT